MRYRKKPVEVEAVRWSGNYDEWERSYPRWIRDYTSPTEDGQDGAFTSLGRADGTRNLIVRTPNGEVTAKPGEMIILGLEGEVYPCDPVIFERTYEPAIDWGKQ